MDNNSADDWDNIVDSYQQHTSRGITLTATTQYNNIHKLHHTNQLSPIIDSNNQHVTQLNTLPGTLLRQQTIPVNCTPQSLPDIIRQMSHHSAPPISSTAINHQRRISSSTRSSVSSYDIHAQSKRQSISVPITKHHSAPATPTSTPHHQLTNQLPLHPQSTNNTYRASISGMLQRVVRFTFSTESTNESKQPDDYSIQSTQSTPNHSPSATIREQSDSINRAHRHSTHSFTSPNRSRIASIDEEKVSFNDISHNNQQNTTITTNGSRVQSRRSSINQSDYNNNHQSNIVHKNSLSTKSTLSRSNSSVAIATQPLQSPHQLNLEQMIESVLTMEHQLQLIIDSCHTQYTTVNDTLHAVKTQLLNVRHTFERININDNESIIHSLMNSDKLHWQFDHTDIQIYRATSLVDRSKYNYTQWHIPQYFSNKAIPKPLPDTVYTVSIAVLIPGCTYDKVHQVINNAYTAQQCIHDIYHRHKLTYQSCREYVLKSHNSAEFMYGSTPLISYDYVRCCIRHKTDIVLYMIIRPSPMDILPIESELPQLYHNKIDTSIKPINIEQCISISDIHTPISITINGLEHCTSSILPRLNTCTQLYVKTYLFYGNTVIPGSFIQSEHHHINNDIYMEQLHILYNNKVCNLPRSTRIALLLCGEQVDGSECVVGYCVQPLIDQFNILKSGHQQIKLYPVSQSSTTILDEHTIMHASTTQNNTLHGATILHITYDTYIAPVYAPIDESYRQPDINVVGGVVNIKQLSAAQLTIYHKLLTTDMLYELTLDDKTVLWQMRHSYMTMSHMLHKFLQCVPWCSFDHRMDAITCMKRWTVNPSSIVSDILPLLDYRHSDYNVRQYAVQLLGQLSDELLYTYLLQIIQCIKYESYHNNPLTQYILHRSLLSPLHIGHYVYYYCTVEMLSNPQYCERYYCLIEQLLHLCPRLTYELHKQHLLLNRLQHISQLVTRLKRIDQYSDDEINIMYVNEINQLDRDVFHCTGTIKLPYNPRMEVNGIDSSQCRYMSSKKLPLWLTFHSAHTNQLINVIFKLGDDLRQDQLTLQLIDMFDQLWLQHGLDLCMKPYGVIATGMTTQHEGIGVVEVVVNSRTMSEIQIKYGGTLGALKNDVIDQYLHSHNPSNESYQHSVTQFISSCAGYSIATFILGIADRHNSNIMIQSDGHLFHIDFGHILGNFKKKFGVNRERAAFVFTTEMAYVMGKKNYRSSELFQSYIRYTNHAFTILRVHSQLIESMFICMLSSGLPELTCLNDILYVRDKLYLDVDENQANQKFMNEIEKSLNTTYRRIDNMIHNLKHRYQS